MDPWQSLQKITLMGTERRQEVVHGEGPLGDLLSSIFSEVRGLDRDRALLHAVAAASLHRRCGRNPYPQYPEESAPAEPDELLPAGPSALHRLAVILEDSGYRDLLPEWLKNASSCGRRAGELLLPLLLDAGKRDRSLRPALLPVIGNRGRWLARLNDHWSYAVAGGDGEVAEQESRVWEEGSTDARLLHIQELRRRDPDYALQLVRSVWATEGARERADFLEALRTGLSLKDEEFLESCLDDRSKEVRRTAAALLSSLAGSALCHRLAQRAAQFLGLKDRGALLGVLGRKHSLEVILPEWDQAMERDGIARKPPAGRGEKGWWLEQMLGAVPPSFWCRRWGLGPSGLIAAACAEDQWRELVLSGWVEAAKRHGDEDWACAFMEAGIDGEGSLWEAVAPERRESLMESILSQAKKREARAAALARIPFLRGPWSARLTVMVAEAWNDVLAAPLDYRLQGLVRLTALRMDPAEHAAVRKILGGISSEESPQGKAAMGMLDLYAFRCDMINEIKQGR